MIQIISKFKVIITSISIIAALILPISLYFNTGVLAQSISSYYYVNNSLLNICLVIIACGFFTGKDSFKISGILLLTLTVISIDFGILHNVIAGSFFLYTTVLIVIDKRFKYFSIPIIIAIPTAYYISLYFFEIIAIYSIAIFNLLYLLRYLRILKLK